MPTYAAVDLGATSGRVVNVAIDADGVALDVVHRFPTTTRAGRDGLEWDMDALFAEIVTGLADAAARTAVASVGVDGWGVDYGLLDASGARLGPVHAYRSHRTDGVMERALERLGRTRLYGATGTQFLPFNTAWQLLAAAGSAELASAASLLMVPDIVNHGLCGSTTNDVTNASTTQLLDVRARIWSEPVLAELGLSARILPALHEPGARLGTIRADVVPAAAGVPVVAVASHDTASAIAGTPLAAGRPAIYISCGTWALVGCELAAPVTDDAALRANVTNELGVEGTTRLLKNVTGLWLLEECRRSWERAGLPAETATLVRAAAGLEVGRAVLDPDDPALTGTGEMPAKIASACAATGQYVPASPAEVTRVILDSLALSFRRTVGTIERVAGITAPVVHLVGGGARNGELARVTASAIERPLLVGPVEATVVGNALVQAIADGGVRDIAAGRRLVEAALPPHHVAPEALADWQALSERLAPTATAR
jgi:rhamnulokinase